MISSALGGRDMSERRKRCLRKWSGWTDQKHQPHMGAIDIHDPEVELMVPYLLNDVCPEERRSQLS